MISLILGISCGTAVALTEFPGRNLVVSIINAGMALPPVVVGLFVTVFLWRNGPFGFLEMLYTPAAMVLAQLFFGLRHSSMVRYLAYSISEEFVIKLPRQSTVVMTP